MLQEPIKQGNGETAKNIKVLAGRYGSIAEPMHADGGKADILLIPCDVCF
jgi:hypothetical protein